MGDRSLGEKVSSMYYFRGAILIYFRNEERVIREKERQSRYIRHMRVMVANDMKTRERIDVQEREDRYKSSSL